MNTSTFIACGFGVWLLAFLMIWALMRGATCLTD